MEGSIVINGLRLFGRHGVYEEELLNGNTFELTLLLDYDISRPMISDDINDTLNYAQAVEIIRKEMETPSKLLEHVASRIRRALITEYPAIKGGFIRIAKLNPPIPADMNYVAVTIKW